MGIATILYPHYHQAFSLLQGYDEGFRQSAQGDPHSVDAWPINDVRLDLQDLRVLLIKRGEATELFARERGTDFESLWGNLEATLFGELAYPTIPSRAAHLLYFVIKNHPFSDGNKRSAAFLMLSYLHRAGVLFGPGGEMKISPMALVAVTVMIAESSPQQKEILVELVMQMLERFL